MVKQIKAAGFSLEFLAAGDALESGGTVADGYQGLRIDGLTELVGRGDELSKLGRAVYHHTGGAELLAARDWHALMVGDAVSGHQFFGPYVAEDEHQAPGPVYGRMRALEQSEESYVEISFEPLESLVSIDPDERPVGVSAKPADIELPGVGTMKQGTYYFTVCVDGRAENAFAIIGNELIEVADLVDGQPINWAEGGICDPVRGEEGFFHPAWMLLKHLNTDGIGVSAWQKYDHDTFTDTLRRCGVESWTYDGAQGCYRVSVGADDEYTIRTPEQAYAYMAGLRAVRGGK